MHNPKLVLTLALGLSALTLIGCATSTAPGAVGADRGQLLLVSSEEMNNMAAQAYD